MAICEIFERQYGCNLVLDQIYVVKEKGGVRYDSQVCGCKGAGEPFGTEADNVQTWGDRA